MFMFVIEWCFCPFHATSAFLTIPKIRAALTLPPRYAFRKRRRNAGWRSDAKPKRSGSIWRRRGKTERPRRQR